MFDWGHYCHIGTVCHDFPACYSLSQTVTSPRKFLMDHFPVQV